METSKRADRRRREGWFEKYLVGRGIDIGCGGDPITLDCTRWEVLDGDAQLMCGVADESFDWVYSSHCLEHVADPTVALSNWWRILRPGGYLLVVVPDEDLYEQGRWPSTFNPEHQTTWSIFKGHTWSTVHRSLAVELANLPHGQVLSLRLLDDGYNYTLQGGFTASVVMDEQLYRQSVTEMELQPQHNPLRILDFRPIDQTNFNAEVSIEGIVRKWQ